MGRLLKIYFWQAISILLNFASLFVVTPYLTTSPGVFGIYTIVTSLVLFLSYADLGFIGAGTKYASEYFVQKDLIKEIKMIGFVGFVLSVFVILYVLFLCFIAYNPSILIKGLTENGASIATKLLLTLAVSSPVFVGQRLVQIIYGIRLEDYHYQKILILSNLVKILSVLYFFRKGVYDIVGYFVFSQVCSAIALIFGLCLSKKRFSYNFGLLIRSFRFDSKIYKTANKLAFSSLFLTICWIAYYDLPPFVISKILGPYQIAMYGIGLTLIGLFRALFGIIFSPFNTKFNYFIGLKDISGLKQCLFKVLSFSLPITMFPVIALSLTAESFIFSWVGPNYVEAIPIAQFLVLSYLWSFISYPAGMMILALENVKSIMITSAILPMIYWLGVLISFKYWGINSFAIFKLVAFSFAAVVYAIVILKLLKIDFRNFISQVIMPSIIPLMVLVTTLLFVRDYLPLAKTKTNLLICGIVNGFVISFATLIYYFTSAIFRGNVNEIFSRLKSRYLTLKEH